MVMINQSLLLEIGYKISIFKSTKEYILCDVPVEFFLKKAVSSWELNRLINNDHVNELEIELRSNLEKSKNNSWLMPVVHLSMEENNKDGEEEVNYIFSIIDGQHRIEALKRVIDNNEYPKVECYIWFVKGEKDKLELFNKINNNLRLDEDDLPSSKIKSLIVMLESYYEENNSIKIFRSNGNRPYINIGLFKSKLENINWMLYDVEDVFNGLKKMNLKYLRNLKSNKLDEMIDDYKKISKKSIDKSKKHKFVLGLDKEMKYLDYIFR